MRILIFLLLIVFGLIAVIYGEADDSPGLQGLGLILITSVIFFAYRNRKRT